LTQGLGARSGRREEALGRGREVGETRARARERQHGTAVPCCLLNQNQLEENANETLGRTF
ncbi:MAG: hypothetical protein RSC06_11415, partial [Clostridia bacterium]